MIKNTIFQKWSLIFGVILIFQAFSVLCQVNENTVTKVECKLWDDAFLEIFHGSLFAIPIAVIIGAIVAGLLAKETVAKPPIFSFA